MLRELNENEMMMVSGGAEAPKDEVVVTAKRLPKVRNKPPRWGNDRRSFDDGGQRIFSLGDGTITINCCSIPFINAKINFFKIRIKPKQARRMMPYPFRGPSHGVTGWVGDNHFTNGVPNYIRK